MLAIIIMCLFVSVPASLVLISIPRDPSELPIYPKEVLEYQIQRTYETFLAYKMGFNDYLLGKEVEAHIQGERIYFIERETDDGNMYDIKHFDGDAIVERRGATPTRIKVHRYAHEAQLVNSSASRGFFIKTCGSYDHISEVL